MQTSNRTRLLILLLAVLAGGLILLAKQSSQPQTPPSMPITYPTLPPELASPQQTTLALSPNPLAVASASATIDVIIDTGKGRKPNRVTAVQLELSFDPKLISGIYLTPGAFFAKPIVMINQVDVKSGKATYALGIAPSATPPTGAGTVAKLHLRLNLKPQQSTQIMLLPSSLVTAEGISQSVLKTTAGTTITIKENF